MRPVNLIPPEDRRGDRAPLRAGPLSYVLLGALLLAFLGVYMMVSAGNSISENEAQVRTLEDSLASTQARAEALSSFGDFASLEQTRTETVSSLARSRFDWERVLRELALVVPAHVTLSSLTGSVSGGAAATESGEGASAATGSSAVSGAPSVQMTGCAADHDSVAQLVAALRDIDGVTRVGLASTSQGAAEGASTGGATAPAGVEGGTCSAEEASFDVTVAFDGVATDPATGGIVPQAPPEEGGVAEAEGQHQEAQDAVEGAQDDADQAVDYLPGA
jgi:Tfp pilus assembly protein PilN